MKGRQLLPTYPEAPASRSQCPGRDPGWAAPGWASPARSGPGTSAAGTCRPSSWWTPRKATAWLKRAGGREARRREAARVRRRDVAGAGPSGGRREGGERELPDPASPLNAGYRRSFPLPDGAPAAPHAAGGAALPPLRAKRRWQVAPSSLGHHRRHLLGGPQARSGPPQPRCAAERYGGRGQGPANTPTPRQLSTASKGGQAGQVCLSPSSQRAPPPAPKAVTGTVTSARKWRRRAEEAGADARPGMRGRGGAGGRGAVSRRRGLRCRVSLGRGDRSHRAAGGGRLSSERPWRKHRGGSHSTGTAQQGGAVRQAPLYPELFGVPPAAGAGRWAPGARRCRWRWRRRPTPARAAGGSGAAVIRGCLLSDSRRGAGSGASSPVAFGFFGICLWVQGGICQGGMNQTERMSCVLQTGDCQPALTPGSSAQLAKHSGQRPKGLSLLAVGSFPRGCELAEASWWRWYLRGEYWSRRGNPHGVRPFLVRFASKGQPNELWNVLRICAQGLNRRIVL